MRPRAENNGGEGDERDGCGCGVRRDEGLARGRVGRVEHSRVALVLRPVRRRGGELAQVVLGVRGGPVRRVLLGLEVRGGRREPGVEERGGAGGDTRERARGGGQRRRESRGVTQQEDPRPNRASEHGRFQAGWRAPERDDARGAAGEEATQARGDSNGLGHGRFKAGRLKRRVRPELGTHKNRAARRLGKSRGGRRVEPLRGALAVRAMHPPDGAQIVRGAKVARPDIQVVAVSPSGREAREGEEEARRGRRSRRDDDGEERRPLDEGVGR